MRPGAAHLREWALGGVRAGGEYLVASMSGPQRVEWPNDREFAFTIVDDTDNATLENVGPVYGLLNSLGIKTTKTVWVYPPKSEDPFTGASLQDKAYLDWIRTLQSRGFEIALHNVASGTTLREEILKGLREFSTSLGSPPRMQINHASNPDNLYWGGKRFGYPVRWGYQLLRKVPTGGDDMHSPFFWGDYGLQHVKYIRNHVFPGVNTLKADPYMPYFCPNRDYANLWFSSSDGGDVQRFNRLLGTRNLDALRRERGACIVYTHFASGFVERGQVNPETRDALEKVGSSNGWFVPCSELLDWLAKWKYGSTHHALAWREQLTLDLRWLAGKLRMRLIDSGEASAGSRLLRGERESS